MAKLPNYCIYFSEYVQKCSEVLSSKLREKKSIFCLLVDIHVKLPSIHDPTTQLYNPSEASLAEVDKSGLEIFHSLDNKAALYF